MTEQIEFFNEPANLSGWQLVGKTFVGLLIGWIIAALLFVILSFMWTIFTSAFWQQADMWGNPMLSIVLLFIWFLSTFIGNIAVGGIYSLFYNRKYYNTGKMFALLFLTNGILFFFLAPIYIVFSNQLDVLFLVLGFHVLFSVFVSAAQIEFSTNPNYCASSMVGTILGFVLALLMYVLVYKASGTADPQQKTYLFMLLPPILWYGIIPFGAGLREKIYYKSYEMGNNGLYIPSIAEISEEVDMQDMSPDSGDEINVEN